MKMRTQQLPLIRLFWRLGMFNTGKQTTCVGTDLSTHQGRMLNHMDHNSNPVPSFHRVSGSETWARPQINGAINCFRKELEVNNSATPSLRRALLNRRSSSSGEQRQTHSLINHISWTILTKEGRWSLREKHSVSVLSQVTGIRSSTTGGSQFWAQRPSEKLGLICDRCSSFYINCLLPPYLHFQLP